MDPRLKHLADVLVEIVVREIETPSLATNQDDGDVERDDADDNATQTPAHSL